jgi:Ni,Fe-hydrogenase I cytochrome b subunit
MAAAEHPIWPVARLCVIMLALGFILHLNAEKFNTGEIQSIAQMFLIAGSTEGAVQLAHRLLRGKKED